MSQQRPPKNSELLLKQWALRDDRLWVKTLADHDWSNAYCRKSLHPVLRTIVTSLQFGSHSRYGVQAPENELSSFEEKFLSWMNTSGEWRQMQSAWKANSQGPWSLPLYLSRSYLRFKHQLPASSSPRSAEPAGMVSEDFVKELSGPILKAFFEMTRELPVPEQLSYILHLEGLVDDEIAALLGRDAALVHAEVLRAKEAVEAAARERNSV